MTRGKGPLPPPPAPWERRSAERHPTSLAGTLQAEDDQELALVKNMSETGALVLTRAIFDADETVELVVYVPKDGPREVRGTVTWVEKTDPKTSELWPYRVGVRFAARPDFADAIADVSELQARMGVIRQ